MTVCKHTDGWYTKKYVSVFVYPNKSSTNNYYLYDANREILSFSPETVEMDNKKNKIVLHCNNPSCHVKRNVYIYAKVKTWGKIKV